MSGNRLPVATSEKSTRPASRSWRLMLIASPFGSMIAGPKTAVILRCSLFPRRASKDGHKRRWPRLSFETPRKRAAPQDDGRMCGHDRFVLLPRPPLRQHDLVVQEIRKLDSFSLQRLRIQRGLGQARQRVGLEKDRAAVGNDE